MKNLITIGFAILLGLLAFDYHYAQRTFQALQRDQVRIAEEQGLRLEILALLKTYVDAETGQRGFLLTGEEKYLEPYDRAVQALKNYTTQAPTFSATENEFHAMLARAFVPGKAKLEDLANTIELRRTQGLEAAIEAVKKNEGKALMDAIRLVLADLDDLKKQSSAALLKEAAIQQKRAASFSTAITLILGCSLLGLFVISQRHLRERETLLEATQEAGDALQKALAQERAAHSEATHANKLKDEFIAVVSHELRTPLNAIVGWTSLLRQGAESEAELTEGLDTIDRNARAQAHLIDDLLDISRIITGKVRLNITEVNLRALVVSVVDGLRPAATAHGVKITIGATAEASDVLGDSDRLQQVVWNLLNNAIKFTPRGGSVDLSVGNFESRVAIEVTDTGQGMRADFLPRIFDRFSQADTSTTRGQAGLGLGLAITRHLVELHGGRISARSLGEGRGSTFRVEIPIVAVRELKQQLAQRETGHPDSKPLPQPLPQDILANLCVLSVDDQADTLSIVNRVLTRAGADVRIASSAAEALGILRHWKPDIIISDIGMPGQDGYSLVREIRHHPDLALREVRTLALTAFARDQDRKEAIDAGFNDHLSKPVEAGALVQKVAHLAGRA